MAQTAREHLFIIPPKFKGPRFEEGDNSVMSQEGLNVNLQA